jgi:tetratricopeptide (TPR) repeat protein
MRKTRIILVNMATFRNELAKSQLEYLLEWGSSNPEITILLGKIYLAWGDPDSALAFAREGLNIVRAQKERFLLKDAHELLGDIYQAEELSAEAATHYNLAYEAIKDFRYTPIIDLINFKRALTVENDLNIQDSLYSQIIVESSSKFVSNLCLYQLGYEALRKKDGTNAKNHFDKIISSDDIKTSRYLKWRALYNLAPMADREIGLGYLREAEIICGNYPEEPDYIKGYYGFNEERADLYFSLADLFLMKKNMEVAVNYMETAYSARVSGRHFSIGNFDRDENKILDRVFMNLADTAITTNGQKAADTLVQDRKYRVLWGKAASLVEDLKAELSDNEAVLRFYRVDSSYTGVYLDNNSIEMTRYRFGENDLRSTLAMLGDLMANQSKSDSALEKWYTELITPFEDLLLTREKVVLIPDGVLHLMPLEALKMPDGDYLSEMFEVKRNISLPSEFPEEIGKNEQAVPAIEPSFNPEIRLVQYIAEPFSTQTQNPDYAVMFNDADFSFYGEPAVNQNGMVCMVGSVHEKNISNLVLQAFLSLRNGNYGFAFPLWRVSDELKSSYYWNLLKNLSEGSGFWNSWNLSRSYLFGHFEGLPYFWGANVYSGLN